MVSLWQNEQLIMIYVTLTYFSMPQFLKKIKNSIFGAVFYKPVEEFSSNLHCFEGKKSNKILMTLTLLLLSHKYFST